MGTPEFALSRRSPGSSRRGTRSPPSTPSRRGRPGAAWRRANRRSTLFAERHGIPVHTPKSLKGEAEQRAFAGHRADVGVVVAYGLILPKPRAGGAARTAASTCMPRRCRAGAAPRPSSAPSWPATPRRPRPSCAWTRVSIRARLPHRARADRAGHDGRRAARSAGREGRRADGARAGRSRARRARTARRSRPRASPMPPRSTRTRRRIDFTRPAGEVHNQVRGLSPAPGAWFEASHEGRAERIKVLRTELVATASGPPGTVLDDALTIACGEGAVACWRCSAPAGGPWRRRSSCAASRSARHAAVERRALSIAKIADEPRAADGKFAVKTCASRVE